ncbi:MAG: VCBS repeat-containing protein [Sedimentisphaerales bacterium]|nr:VCBS repeat-containing protein [Sedimentisphaerales bacterium]
MRTIIALQIVGFLVSLQVVHLPAQALAAIAMSGSSHTDVVYANLASPELVRKSVIAQSSLTGSRPRQTLLHLSSGEPNQAALALLIEGDLLNLKSADMDGDGLDDLIVGSVTIDADQTITGHITIFYNTSSQQSFYTQQIMTTIAIPHAPDEILIGDLDSSNDGNPCLDILAISNAGHVIIAYHPRQEPLQHPDTCGKHPSGYLTYSTLNSFNMWWRFTKPSLGDVNNDGYPDLIYVASDTNEFAYILNDTFGVFVLGDTGAGKAKVLRPLPENPTQTIPVAEEALLALVKILDINADGSQDIVTLDTLGKTFWVLFQDKDSKGSFTQKTFNAFKGATTLNRRLVAVTDYTHVLLDPNPYPDIIALIKKDDIQIPQAIVVHLTNGVFSSEDLFQREYPLEYPANHIRFGNLDDNTDPEAVLSNQVNKRLTIFYNVRSKAFTQDNREFVNLNYQPIEAHLVDLDGDAANEILVVTSWLFRDNIISVKRKSANTYEVDGSIIDYSGDHINSVTLADVDGDGDLDIIGQRSSDIVVFKNNNSAVFNLVKTIPMDKFLDYGSYSYAVGDINRDGHLDFVGAFMGASIGVSLSDADGGYSEMVSYGQPGSASCALGDVDNDGLIDVVTAGSGSVSIRRNTGKQNHEIFGPNLFPVRKEYTVKDHEIRGVLLTDLGPNPSGTEASVADMIFLTKDSLLVKMNPDLQKMDPGADLFAGCTRGCMIYRDSEWKDPIKVECGTLDNTCGPDIVVGDAQTSMLTILYNVDVKGDECGYDKVVRILGPAHLREFCVADIDRDETGLGDIVSFGDGPKDSILLYVDLNNNQKRKLVGLEIEGRALTVKGADIDGDGYGDVVVGSTDDGKNYVTVFYNNRTTGLFDDENKSSLPVPIEPDDIIIGDFDTAMGEGCPDFIVHKDVVLNDFGPAIESAKIAVILYPQTGPIVNGGNWGRLPVNYAPQIQTYDVGSSRSIVLRDMNGDGFMDVITVPGHDENYVSLLLNDRRGGLLSESEEHFSMGWMPQFLAVGDLNGDGLPDIVTANPGLEYDGQTTVSIRLNRQPSSGNGSNQR